MKVHEKGSDRKAEVEFWVLGGVSPCDEYGEHIAGDGAICCFVPVEANQRIKLYTHFAGTTMKLQHDVLVDGILRQTKIDKSTSVKKKNYHSDITKFRFQYDKEVKETEIMATKIDSNVNLVEGEEEIFGMIEVRISVLRRFGQEYSLRDIALYPDDPEDGHEETEEAGYTKIAPQFRITHDKNVPFMNRRSAREKFKQCKDQRPGKEPWAVFRYYYRTLQSILDANLHVSTSEETNVKGETRALDIEEVPLLKIGDTPGKSEAENDGRSTRQSTPGNNWPDTPAKGANAKLGRPPMMRPSHRVPAKPSNSVLSSSEEWVLKEISTPDLAVEPVETTEQDQAHQPDLLPGSPHSDSTQSTAPMAPPMGQLVNHPSVDIYGDINGTMGGDESIEISAGKDTSGKGEKTTGAKRASSKQSDFQIEELADNKGEQVGATSVIDPKPGLKAGDGIQDEGKDKDKDKHDGEVCGWGMEVLTSVYEPPSQKAATTETANKSNCASANDLAEIDSTDDNFVMQNSNGTKVINNADINSTEYTTTVKPAHPSSPLKRRILKRPTPVNPTPSTATPTLQSTKRNTSAEISPSTSPTLKRAKLLSTSYRTPAPRINASPVLSRNIPPETASLERQLAEARKARDKAKSDRKKLAEKQALVEQKLGPYQQQLQLELEQVRKEMEEEERGKVEDERRLRESLGTLREFEMGRF
ncbi:uncharacterized protein BDR25DRAFT_340611 [Lindgomyces ingoldianus]|uniref:Uncharacterized protein n=1 Tax=Lindgomyces ingoldianus TaxID=673940 RepID=A0ACB6R939_9PLEO|nr:uncharacterized protein BDR25DRAFT_340611 [Lindgomyces ingoldianus]KAF2474981.1 hypothetical protein BDR25DRAFT_340611 [Lindgomyces ingoldianus]